MEYFPCAMNSAANHPSFPPLILTTNFILKYALHPTLHTPVQLGGQE